MTGNSWSRPVAGCASGCAANYAALLFPAVLEVAGDDTAIRRPYAAAVERLMGSQFLRRPSVAALAFVLPARHRRFGTEVGAVGPA